MKLNFPPSLSRNSLLIFCLILLFSSCNKEKQKPFLMGNGFGLHSYTMLVEDLEAVAGYYRDTLGFDVPEDYEKSAYTGSHLAFISFPDWSALEIMAPIDTLQDRQPDFIDRFIKNQKGIAMYALSSSSVDSTNLWLKTNGFKMDSIKSYRTSDEEPDGWSWDDGGAEEKRVDFANLQQTGYQPAFVEYLDTDYQKVKDNWNSYYQYERRYVEHPNGIVGTRALIIAVKDAERASKEFVEMGFEQIPYLNEANVSGFKVMRNQDLLLVTPTTEDSDISRFLNERESGVYAIRFEVKNIEKTYEFLKKKFPTAAMEWQDSSTRLVVLREYGKGVQLEFVEESEEQKQMALKLRPDDKLDSSAMVHAEALYTKYCALCHGNNREGYAADNAPSLRSHSLLATSKSTNFLRYTIHYGREGTAMAGYLDRQGGPLEYIEVELLMQWLYEMSEVDSAIELSREPVRGDVQIGKKLYDKNCAVCHGKGGEGVSAPALSNPMLLATATDHFLRYAIAEGREGTPMIGFKDSLSNEEIDGLTAFLRSRASGWDIPKKDTVTVPTPDNYVLNPDRDAPDFTLKDGKYLPANQLIKALQDSLRIVILDARSEVAWRQTHIPGAIPVPYYEEPENFVKDIPNDSTWVVAYCACPHAASERVINTLRRNGFKNTAILDEGILTWAQLGYPVQNGN